MSRRRISGWVIATGVVVALVVGAISVVSWFKGRLPGEPYDLDKACAGTTYDNAAPYEGSGPHPIAVFMPGEAGHLEYTRLYPPKGAAWSPADPADSDDVQLVACGTLTNEEQSKGLDCSYGVVTPGRTLPMVRATYQVRIYELRTHREVDSLLLEGDDTECPPSISGYHSSDRLLSELTFAQWQEAIGDLVTKNR